MVAELLVVEHLRRACVEYRYWLVVRLLEVDVKGTGVCPYLVLSYFLRVSLQIES